MDRAEIVHTSFLERVRQGDLPNGAPNNQSLLKHEAVAIYRSQCLSRALDLKSRDMQKKGQGYYTIGSSGHEGMAAIATALRPSDMAFLHYRDAAFQISRASQVPGQTPLWDIALSFCCSTEDPIAGGRHKVLGSKALNIPPQTSTIASHLPKAIGAAYSINLAKRHVPEHASLDDNGLVVCSFGDASLNHSTAQGAINTACWTSYQSVPLPLLFVCEDNGIGISTPTPQGWVANNLNSRSGLEYFYADGLNIYDTFAVASQAAQWVRKRKKPAVIHLRTVRLYGHAGSDVPTSYMSRRLVEADEANDPLLHTVRLLRDADALGLEDALSIYQETLSRVDRVANEATARPRLSSAKEVMDSIIPPHRSVSKKSKSLTQEREDAFGIDLRVTDTPQPMNRLLNWALTDLMLEHREIILAGEDIGRKGGVYGVTQKLQKRFGPDRVLDTLLDEQSILGLAMGLAHNGFVPIPEIQFLAYLHNAEDQLRGEAATLSFFSNGQYTNPMVLRIAGLGYQKGFGGHFHNDNSLAVLRDIPGLVIACPSRGDDAVLMLRECVRLAREEQRVVVFVEPIALYTMRDLLDDKDGMWMTHYPQAEEAISLGTVGQNGDGTDLAIVTYGNGHYLSIQAQSDLKMQGHDTRVIDIRWLAPLSKDALMEATKGCSAVLVVDECRRTGGQAEALVNLFTQAGHKKVAAVTAEDSFIATGPAYSATMPSRTEITAAALELII